ncbi:TPA: hypothetical protein EYO12_03350 [Candidatus Saccharibacteria bacterium]|nr:hypothetical protein [Candidatus Saccharibacteria bacterium]HIO87931.1 hypothetical protein [Candidatus Saccharibacteria bacterium]
MFQLFAHGGEDHSDSAEAAQHVLALNPFIATMFVVGFVILSTTLIYKVTKSSTAASYSLLAQLLGLGVFSYSVLPLLSGLCIVVGFALSMLLAFGGLHDTK